MPNVACPYRCHLIVACEPNFQATSGGAAENRHRISYGGSDLALVLRSRARNLALSATVRATTSSNVVSQAYLPRSRCSCSCNILGCPHLQRTPGPELSSYAVAIGSVCRSSTTTCPFALAGIIFAASHLISNSLTPLPVLHTPLDVRASSFVDWLWTELCLDVVFASVWETARRLWYLPSWSQRDSEHAIEIE